MRINGMGQWTVIAFLCLVHPVSLSSQEDAQPSKSTKEKLADIIVLNENGRVSISYDKAGWFPGSYATLLGETLEADLSLAEEECDRVLEQLEEAPTQTLDRRTETIVATIFALNPFDYGPLFSSILAKHADKQIWIQRMQMTKALSVQ